MSVQLGTFGAWFNPAYDDSARVRFVAEAEALGYTTAWLGMGRRSVADLSVVERALDVTSTIVVARYARASSDACIREHIQAMKAFVESTGGAPVQVKFHPIRFGSGDWTCVVGKLEDDSRMVTLAKWRDGAIAEEYVWI